MKKYVLALFVFSSLTNFAQNTFPASGNVGIGTNSPSDKLHVAGSAQFDSNIFLGHTGDSNLIRNREVNQTLDIGSTNYTSFSTYTSAWNERIRIANNGNVGIGTTSPSDKLHVAGSAQFDSNIFLGHTGDSSLIRNREVNQTLDIGSTNYTSFSTYTSIWNERMRIASNGNVGIGITNPNNKLDVNGTIHSKEVKVDISGWSDFVFKKEYTLPTLEEVEKQINEKGHLANIPSEKDVLKNGINLGEMNANLLQKMEEMTLYMIEQNKRMNKLEIENQELKNKIDSIIK